MPSSNVFYMFVFKRRTDKVRYPITRQYFLALLNRQVSSGDVTDFSVKKFLYDSFD